MKTRHGTEGAKGLASSFLKAEHLVEPSILPALSQNFPVAPPAFSSLSQAHSGPPETSLTRPKNFSGLSNSILSFKSFPPPVLNLLQPPSTSLSSITSMNQASTALSFFSSSSSTSFINFQAAQAVLHSPPRDARCPPLFHVKL
ncbi:hypothetical protein E2C01_071757 [Portunus trituberculatus]|uniref:Uncharacterized protein n=1 Tax=Portunus trituberculatus TaxID=210409 RepID=A0A5B7I5W7_PORTR|nr:hypothetical protein [Portunus trituberculatus]